MSRWTFTREVEDGKRIWVLWRDGFRYLRAGTKRELLAEIRRVEGRN